MKPVLIALWIFVLLVPVVACGSSNGSSESGNTDSDLSVTAADAGTQKFAVSIQGDDVGYMQLDISDHGTDSLLITQTISWNMILMGNRRDIEMTMIAVSDREYDLGHMEMQMSDGSATITIRAWRQDSLLISEIGTAGRVIENSTVLEEDYLPVLADLACASMEWTEGQERTFKSFDPASGMIISKMNSGTGERTVSFFLSG